MVNGSRNGQRMGDWKMVDTMIVDGLWDVYNQYHMGITLKTSPKKTIFHALIKIIGAGESAKSPSRAGCR